MNKEVNVIQVVGKNHGKIEDATLIEENERFIFLGIADGKSGTQFGKIGGDISLKALFEYFNKNGTGNIDEMYEEEVKYEIIKYIRKELGRQAEFLNTTIKEMASTLVAIVIDKVTEDFLVCHLGDGCILGINKENISYISTPKNGITNKYTWTTASNQAAEQMKIKRKKIKEYSKIYLMSDGCECFHQGAFIPFRGKEVLLKAEKKQLEKAMQQSGPEDDATLIVLTR